MNFSIVFEQKVVKVICSCCHDIDVQLYADISISDKKPSVSQCLPVLELDSGLTIASVNQAARFILPPLSSAEAEVDQWLDWDSSQLQVSTITSCS